MSIGKGIAIVGIWGSVAAVGIFSHPLLAGVLGGFAFIATIFMD